MTPIIVGLSGSQVTPDERAALQRVAPAGFILFARNIVDPVQLRALTDDLRDASGRDDLPILTDQEGGAVARLRPPHWPATLAAARFAAAYDRAPMTAIRAMRAQGQAVGRMLAAGGITMNAAPVLDLAWPGATPALAQRCLGATPMAVAALGRAMLEGLRADRRADWQVGLYQLIAAYGEVSVRTCPVFHVVADRQVMTLEAALARVSTLLGVTLDWRALDQFLPPSAGALRRSAVASSFLAALELARQGRVELRQAGPFAPLYLRRPA